LNSFFSFIKILKLIYIFIKIAAMVIFIKEKNQTGSSFKKKKNLNKFRNVYKRKEKSRSSLRIFIKLQQWLFL